MEQYENEIIEKDGNTYVRPNKEKVMGLVNAVYKYLEHPKMYMTKCDTIAAYTHLLVETSLQGLSKQEALNAVSDVWDKMATMDGYAYKG